MQGIYVILNILNAKYYIGSAVNVNRRWSEHRYDLQQGDHENPRLQNAYNKYGKDAFVYMLLEEVQDKTQLIPREQYWMDLMRATDKARGYNIQRPVARWVIGIQRKQKPR